ncbi:DUF881 domain-containing protein [Plantactinospora siamensis]|uniref:DUF881 domain-containing protein n=1 Tax=Plantactinospora siamensis TaxID=555372 RepID=A0ABV6NYK0_9ACTN
MVEQRPEPEPGTGGAGADDTGTGWPAGPGPAQPVGEPDPRPDAPPADGVGPLVADPDAPGGAAPESGGREQRPGAGARVGAEAAGGAGAAGAREPDGGVDPDVDPDDGPDPDEGAGRAGGPDPDGNPAGVAGPVGGAGRLFRRPGRPSTAGGMIAVLLLLLGFALAVQLRSNSSDQTLASARQEDLVRILSDLEAQQQRLRLDIAGLEDSQRQLASGAQGRQAALEEATRRADELGILAGTLPARGPGLTVRFSPGSKPIGAATVLDAVQELRGAGAEAMEISGGDGATVRIIASTYFLDADGGAITVTGRRLTGPFTLTVVGEPETMRTALNIAGGVVASVAGDGGNVIVDEHDVVDIRALSPASSLKYAHPVS